MLGGAAATSSTSPRSRARSRRSSSPPMPRPSTEWWVSRTRCVPSTRTSRCPSRRSARVRRRRRDVRARQARRAAPAAPGPPQRVADAVLEALREDRAEVIVNRGPIRPLAALYWLAPKTTVRLLGNRRHAGTPRTRDDRRAGGCNEPLPEQRDRHRLRPHDCSPGTTSQAASMKSPEKGGGPRLIHMLDGTLEVLGR